MMRLAIWAWPVVLAAAACAPVRPAVQPILAERYCYRTLADVECTAAPLPGEASRRVGFFDAPVAYVPRESPYFRPAR